MWPQGELIAPSEKALLVLPVATWIRSTNSAFGEGAIGVHVDIKGCPSTRGATWTGQGDREELGGERPWREEEGGHRSEEQRRRRKECQTRRRRRRGGCGRTGVRSNGRGTWSGERQRRTQHSRGRSNRGGSGGGGGEGSSPGGDNGGGPT
ncbi:hypothetical protein Syun_006466 [Stephania yunnanensis]|uniref:Uncharacterized protein n=1 Tax=Stephania yunnanensis TaxID=152371 RepID=A0AAP0KZA0_9MAGN